MISNPYRNALLVFWILLTVVGVFATVVANGHEKNGTVGLVQPARDFSASALTLAAICFFIWLAVGAVVFALKDRSSKLPGA